MTRSGARQGVAVAAGFVLAALAGGTLWWRGRTSLRWLAFALLLAYLVPWVVAWAWAPGHWRRILARFTLFTLGTAVIWLGLELAAVTGLVNYPALTRAPISEWWYGPPYNVADRDLLYIHRPYLKLTGSQPGDIAANLCLASTVYGYDVRYDRHGFRNEADLDAADVAVIGDSFIEAPTMPTSMTMTSVLARLSGLTVANLGLSAYGPQQELRVMERYALPLRPAIIVWAFYEGNDFKDMARYDGLRAQVRDEARRRFRLEASLARNVLLALQRPLRGCIAPLVPALPSGVLPGAHPIRMHLVRPPAPPPDAELETLAKIFGDADRMTRTIDSRLIVVFVPTSFRVYHDLLDCRDCSEGVDDLSARIERSLRRVSPRIEYLDLTTSLRGAARRGELVYRPDDTHWTAAGHRVAAEAISGVLRARSTNR